MLHNTIFGIHCIPVYGGGSLWDVDGPNASIHHPRVRAPSGTQLRNVFDDDNDDIVDLVGYILCFNLFSTSSRFVVKPEGLSNVFLTSWD